MAPDESPLRVESATAGLLLRQAREAAGLSIDAVAQQLKLAPRQVLALEESDYSRLPGRTFVRGFMRNYARLLNLDAEMVLAALQGAASTASLEAPTLNMTAPSIGELPTSERGKSGMTRWIIPLVLIAIVAGAAVYEYTRQGGDPVRSAAPRTPSPARSTGDATPTTTLPNPTLPNPLQVVGTSPPAAPESAPTNAPASVDDRAAVAPASAPAAAAPGAPEPADATISLSFRDFSWTEVRDRSGRVLIAKMMAGGQQQTLTGTPPFDVVIGNSSDVKFAYRGQPVDLAPLSRGNVARFTLK